MRVYQHNQKSLLFSLFLCLLSLVFLCIYIESGRDIINIIAFSIIVFVIYAFSCMYISIDKKHLMIRFGFGFFTKKIFLSDIKSVKKVRNKWYYGWGIKYVWIPKLTTIYSVYGLDAVEIHLKNGKIFRIGTDEPDALEKILLEKT